MTIMLMFDVCMMTLVWTMTC